MNREIHVRIREGVEVRLLCATRLEAYSGVSESMKQPILVTGGAGYVGLPLAVEFGKKYRTIGFDIKQSRIDELNAGHDRPREVEPAELRSALVCHP